MLASVKFSLKPHSVPPHYYGCLLVIDQLLHIKALNLSGICALPHTPPSSTLVNIHCHVQRRQVLREAGWQRCTQGPLVLSLRSQLL